MCSGLLAVAVIPADTPKADYELCYCLACGQWLSVVHDLIAAIQKCIIRLQDVVYFFIGFHCIQRPGHSTRDSADAHGYGEFVLRSVGMRFDVAAGYVVDADGVGGHEGATGEVLNVLAKLMLNQSR